MGPALALIWIEVPSIRWIPGAWDESARIINNHGQPLGTTLALGSLSKDKKDPYIFAFTFIRKHWMRKQKRFWNLNRIFQQTVSLQRVQQFSKTTFPGYEWPTYKNIAIRSLSKIPTSQICVCSVQ